VKVPVVQAIQNEIAPPAAAPILPPKPTSTVLPLSSVLPSQPTPTQSTIETRPPPNPTVTSNPPKKSFDTYPKDYPDKSECPWYEPAGSGWYKTKYVYDRCTGTHLRAEVMKSVPGTMHPAGAWAKELARRREAWEDEYRAGLGRDEL